MIYKAAAIAQFVIKFCNDTKVPVNNLRLQKLMYFIQAEYIMTDRKPCYSDNIEAWDFGPVIPSLYDKYCIYGSKNIPFIAENMTVNIDKDDENRIVSILRKYIKYGNDGLVRLAYSQVSWQNAYRYGTNHVIKITEMSTRSIRN